MQCFCLVNLPECSAAVVFREVNFLLWELDFLLDVNNWTSSGRTRLSERHCRHDEGHTVRKNNVRSLTCTQTQSQREIRQPGRGRSSCPSPCFLPKSTRTAWLLTCPAEPKARRTRILIIAFVVYCIYPNSCQTWLWEFSSLGIFIWILFVNFQPDKIFTSIL